MGLDDADLTEDGGGKASLVSCSICFEAVTDSGVRSWAKLQCGHEFHLDCIGSAFNIKGAMQCPNCRKIEKGQWLFANGNRQFPEFSMEDWNHDEDLYDLSYSEMSLGVHWCPFSALARLPSSFDEGEFSSTPYHDLPGQHAVLAEHTAVSSSSHPCPYIAYVGPIHHPSSSNSAGTLSDGRNFSNHWNGPPSVPSDMPASYAFPAMDLQYHNWEGHPSPFPGTSNHVGASDQPSGPSMSQRAARANSDLSRSGSYMQPFVVGHSSAARAGSSVSMIPPYQGSAARARNRVQALQAYFQQPSNSPPMHVIPSTQRTSNQRGSMAPPHHAAGMPMLASAEGGGFYFLPSSSLSSRNFQEAPENSSSLSSNFHMSEREHFPFMTTQVADSRDHAWGPFQQQAAGGGGGSDTRSSSNRLRYGSERMPSSQNQNQNRS